MNRSTSSLDGFTHTGGRIVRSDPTNVARAIERLGVGLRAQGTRPFGQEPRRMKVVIEVRGLLGFNGGLTCAGLEHLRLLISRRFGFKPSTVLLRAVVVELALESAAAEGDNNVMRDNNA